MATQTKKTNNSLIGSTANTILSFSTIANDMALKTTEIVFDKSLKMAGLGMNYSNKAIKKGLKITELQQGLFFEALETVKGKLIKKSNK